MSTPETDTPNARLSRPPNFTLNPAGGLSVIPRRGMSAFNGTEFSGPLADQIGLFCFAARSPHKLSEILGASNPTFAKAQSNWIAAVAAPGTARLVAYKHGEDGKDAQDDAATALLTQWLDGLGASIGGFDGLRTKGAQCVLHYGLWPFEAVPGPSGTGVKSLGLVDPDSIWFGTDDQGAIYAYQKDPKSTNGQKVLPDNRFFWYAHYASAANPYGLEIFGSAIEEALKDRANNQDIGDAVHNSAWQHYFYQYNLEVLYRIATSPPDQGGLNLPQMGPQKRNADGTLMTNELEEPVYSQPAQEWVDRQIKNTLDYVRGMSPDENGTMDASGGIEKLDPASFAGLDSILEYWDYRFIRALDEMPTTMGAPKAGAQTYTTAEWASQATKQEMVAWGVLAPIVKAANLHFQLLGQAITVKAEFDPIRKSDALADANAEAVRAKTLTFYWQLGIITKEQLAIQLTGSGPPKDDPEAYTGPIPVASPSPSAPPTNAGTTKDQQGNNP